MSFQPPHPQRQYVHLVAITRELYSNFESYFKLSRETLYLAIAVLLRTCEHVACNNANPFVPICRGNVDLFAKVALVIASKYEDVHDVSYTDLKSAPSTSRHSICELVGAERIVLQVLDFRLTSIRTPEHYRTATVTMCKNSVIGAYTCVDSTSARLLDAFIGKAAAAMFYPRVLGFASVYAVLDANERVELMLLMGGPDALGAQLKACVDAMLPTTR